MKKQPGKKDHPKGNRREEEEKLSILVEYVQVLQLK